MSQLGSYLANLRSTGLGKWYFERERSEQRILAAVAILVIVSLFWASIWKPVSDWQQVQANRQHNAQKLLDWLEQNKQAAQQASKSDSPNGNGSRGIIPVITQAAEAQSLKLTRLQPDANGIVNVVLQEQRFNEIIKWVQQLVEKNEISIDRATFSSQTNPGYVNAQLRLQ